MQLSDKSGIGCDLCASQHRLDFTYYNLDCRECPSSSTGVAEQLERAFRRPICSSHDCCPTCYDALCESVLQNQAAAGVFRCELSGRILSGKFVYYYVIVTKVRVQSAGNNFNVTSDPRWLEFNIATSEHQRLLAQTAANKEVPSQWQSHTGNSPSAPR